MVATWEELSDLANPIFRALVEMNPHAYYPTGSNWVSEGTNTYSHACKEVKVSTVTDDGQEMTERATVALVKANAGSWYFDKPNQILYVHCFDSDDLSSVSVDTVVVAFVWKMFSTDACEFNGIQYMPIVRQNSLPALGLSVDDLVEGMYRFNFGSFMMNNTGWFDTAAEDYIWTNCKVLIKLGGEDLPYSEHVIYFVGRVSDYSVKDEEVLFTVKDIRVGTYAQLPIDHYWMSNYPKLQTGAEGLAIPIFYGIKKHIVPVCIDSKRTTTPYGDLPYPVNSVWKIAGSRTIKEFTEIRLNFGDIDYPHPDYILTENTHYTTDLSNAEFTLLIPLKQGDTLEVDAKGYVDGGSVLMEKAGTIAKDILKTYLGFVDGDLDLSSFADVDTERPYELCIYLDTDRSSRQILQTVGRSVIAFFTPVENGKLAFEVYKSTVPGDTLELFDRDFGEDWEVKLIDFFLRNKVKLQYDQNPKTQEFKAVEKNNYKVLYKYGIRETLILETYLRELSDAGAIAQAVQNMCSIPIKVVETSCGVKAFKLFPTRKLKITRKRAVDSSGAWDAKVFRVREIVKDMNSEQTRLVAADDFQLLGDIPHVNTPHTDVPHSDSLHTDVPHTDEPHTDTPYTHTPYDHTPHSDYAHQDHFDEMFYTDEPHDDSPHTNEAHIDSGHTNTAHDNTAYSHTPHTDDPYQDVPHGDTPHIQT